MTKRLEQLVAFRDQRPNDPFVHYAVALELKHAGRLSEAEKDFREVVRRFPEYVPTFFHFGQLLEELGNISEARSVYQTGILCAERARDGHAAAELRGALELLGP